MSDNFAKTAENYGIIGVKGHVQDTTRKCRISIYNSINIEEIKTLILFMEDFKNKPIANL